MPNLRNYAIITSILLVCLFLARCGKDSKKDDNNPPTGFKANNLPDNWNGTTDWSESLWEVK